MTDDNAITPEVDLHQYVIYRCVVGSRAFGLDVEGSDFDRRGIFLPPAELHWSLDGVPEQIEVRDSDECYWELQKFLVLALRGNPNVLECLYTPLVEYAAPIATELLEIRSAFISKLLYQTYNGYALSQFRKLEQDLRARGDIKWKHVMHLMRLLISGAEILRTGFVHVQLTSHLDRLRAIRAGQVPWEDIDAWRLHLHRDFEEAYQCSTLPERPDQALINRFLIRARKEMAARASD